MGDLQVPWDRIWEKMKLKSNIFLLVLVSLDFKKKNLDANQTKPI